MKSIKRENGNRRRRLVGEVELEGTDRYRTLRKSETSYFENTAAAVRLLKAINPFAYWRRNVNVKNSMHLRSLVTVLRAIKKKQHESTDGSPSKGHIGWEGTFPFPEWDMPSFYGPHYLSILLARCLTQPYCMPPSLPLKKEGFICNWPRISIRIEGQSVTDKATSLTRILGEWFP